jgi:hypothetical protein
MLVERTIHRGIVAAITFIGCSSFQGTASPTDAAASDVLRRVDAPAEAALDVPTPQIRDVTDLDLFPGWLWCGLTFRACDPATQAGCGDGEGCVVDGLRPPSARCARPSGRLVGARCGDGVGVCDGGLLCILGRCLRACCNDSGRDACGAGSSCAVITEATFVRGCVLAGECDYRTQTGCGASDGCFPQSELGEARCRALGAQRDGQRCALPNDCVAGHTCLYRAGAVHSLRPDV